MRLNNTKLGKVSIYIIFFFFWLFLPLNSIINLREAWNSKTLLHRSSRGIIPHTSAVDWPLELPLMDQSKAFLSKGFNKYQSIGFLLIYIIFFLIFIFELNSYVSYIWRLWVLQTNWTYTSLFDIFLWIRFYLFVLLAK